MAALIDLLSPEPELRLDLPALGQALTFAFATGGTGEDFDRILNRARLQPSRFRPECFTKDLFLGEFVHRCLTLSIDNHEWPLHRGQLLRELTHPPHDPAVLEFRHAILRELVDSPELESALQRVYLEIGKLERLLETSDRGKRYDAIGRRFEILRSVKEAMDVLGASFATASSPLRRIHEFAGRVRETRAYRELANVLDHEAHLATVDLRVRLAQDGQIRGFEIVRARENVDNPLHRSPLSRLFARVRMLLGGYGLRRAEVLGRLANHVFDGMLEMVVALLQLGLHAEFYLGALSFRKRALQCGLAVCLPEFVGSRTEDSRVVELTNVFNPLLLLEERAPVPCNLRMAERAMVIITGPNSGGKTRLLQTMGFVQLLGQAGFFVPAEAARLVLRDGLFVSLIQETSADQPEGRLGMELLRIRRLFEEVGLNSLVILDELCSGTNPSEGEEIFELVISLLAELEPQTFITTHFLQFASRLARDRSTLNLEFLQVELDRRSDPTYGFVPGVARTSLAARTAERLGVTREALEGLVEARKRAHARASVAPVRASPRIGRAVTPE